MPIPSSGIPFTTSMRIAERDELTVAARALQVAAGAGSVMATAWAPGRCTLAGEHVDYAGGLVLCLAVDLGIAAAVRPSATTRYLATSGGITVTRSEAEPVGDIGDRVLAPVVVLRRRGLSVPAVEVGIAATLPAGAGLASSAALIVATTTALLRMTAMTMTARDLAAVALSAERDVLDIPCGPLDQRAIVDAPDGGALLLDCATGATTSVPWPWADAVLVGCDTGSHHDVGGAEYRRRREETEFRARGAACRELSGVERTGPQDGGPRPCGQTAPPARDGGERARRPGGRGTATGRSRGARTPDVGKPSIAP